LAAPFARPSVEPFVAVVAFLRFAAERLSSSSAASLLLRRRFSSAALSAADITSSAWWPASASAQATTHAYATSRGLAMKAEAMAYPPFRARLMSSGAAEFVKDGVQAVIDGGGWDDTTFILTWDEWGGYADSVLTPSIETVPDALHPDGFAVIGGSRIPLVMFGGKVTPGIDSEWHSHASIPKTVIDLVGLPAMGVPRVDAAPSLAGHVDASLSRPVPPAPGTTIVQPTPPHPTPHPKTPAPWSGPLNEPMPALVTLDGSVVPAPTDGLVRPTPPKEPGHPSMPLADRAGLPVAQRTTQRDVPAPPARGPPSDERSGLRSPT
jgi:hypothetical protein